MNTAHGSPSTPHVFVRPAAAIDALTIGILQADAMTEALAASVGDDLDGEIAARVNPNVFADAWLRAITEPPSPAHGVFVAVEDGELVGFAAVAPLQVEGADVGANGIRPAANKPAGETAECTLEATESAHGPEPAARGTFDTTMGAEEPTSAPEAEIIALEVASAHRRRGHGSRLLASLVDECRQRGIRLLSTWCLAEDDARTVFLNSAGFAPTGMRRILAAGEATLTLHRWHTTL